MKNRITIRSKVLLSLDLVCYRHRQTLLYVGSGQCICRILLYDGEVGKCYPRGRIPLHTGRRCIRKIILYNDKVGGPPWTAKEGKECYKMINGVFRKE